MKIYFCVLLILSLSPSSFATNQDIPLARFDGPLKTLESVLNQYDGSPQSLDKVANDLLKGPRRIAAFQLQALGQIYQSYPIEKSNAFFKQSLRFEAKALEDVLGKYDKWNVIWGLSKNNGSSSQKIARAEKERAQAFEILTFVLSGKKTGSLLHLETLSDEYREFLAKFEKGKKHSLFSQSYWIGTQTTLTKAIRTHLSQLQWLSPDEDRKYVLKRLRKHLEELDEMVFNFNLLEDTASEKGLHEFRREVRWFSFQAGVLNGTLNFYDTFMTKAKTPQCPSPSLQDITDPKKFPDLAKSNYSKLPKSPFQSEKVCGISRCLYYKITQIVADVGEVKDKVETGNFASGSGNRTPEWAAKAVQSIYDDMKSRQLIPLLREQLKACYQ